jgi:hypothetical protein
MPVDELHRPRRERPGPALHPGLDLAPADGADLVVAERRIGVETEVGLDLGGRAGAVDLGRAPLLGVIPEQHPAAGRVYVHAVGQVAPDGVEEELGVALAGELAGLLGPSGVLPPPGPVPAVGTLVDAGHGLSSRSVTAISGRQKVPS